MTIVGLLADLVLAAELADRQPAGEAAVGEGRLNVRVATVLRGGQGGRRGGW
jgi:hypothetical protein